MKKRKEDLKELVLYTVFGNMTFIISIGAYAVFNVALGINELIANALAWVFASTRFQGSSVRRPDISAMMRAVS